MNRDELFASIVAARPGRDETVYLERRGDQYDWRTLPLGAAIGGSPPDRDDADVWMSFSAAWPFEDALLLRKFFDDLLAELESMADRADRCRWPIEDPWSHFH